MANEVELEKVSREVFGITSRRYRQLAKSGTVPPVTSGKIDFIMAAKALIDYYRKLAEGQGSSSLVDERTKLTKIQAEIKGLELKRLKGEVLPIASIHEAWGGRVTELKVGLTAWSNKLPPLIHEKGLPEIKEIIEAEVWHLLDRFSRAGTWGDPPPPVSIKNTGRLRK